MASEFTNELRREASELAAATKSIPVNAMMTPDNVTVAITGRVLSRLLGTIADCTDYLAGVMRNESHAAGRSVISERNRIIRDAAAHAISTGNWDKFNTIVDGLGAEKADGK